MITKYTSIILKNTEWNEMIWKNQLSLESRKTLHLKNLLHHAVKQIIAQQEGVWEKNVFLCMEKIDSVAIPLRAHLRIPVYPRKQGRDYFE